VNDATRSKGEPWLRKNAGEIKDLIKNRVPAFLAKQMGAILDKSATELAFPISLIFSSLNNIHRENSGVLSYDYYNPTHRTK
jgi:hypothetical protein